MGEAADDPLVGTSIAQYDIVARLGGGGMGVVYAARDTKLGRRVALKFLPPQWSHDDGARQRFIREAQAASATDHPNICTIHDIATAGDGQLFIVMAHYDGPTLKQRLEGGSLTVEEAIEIAAQLAEGVAKAHGQGVIHRDLKPGNVMLTEEGVKILDFGLAKFADARFKLTLEGSTLGTIAYMSPEQVRGDEADARSDIWAIGAVLYEMLAGGVPFKGGYPEAIAHAIRNDPPAPIRIARPEVPENLEQTVFRALHKDPDVRFQSARDLARALRRLQGRTLPLDLHTEALQSLAAPRPVQHGEWWRRPWRVRGATAAGAIGMILAGGFLLVATTLPGGLTRGILGAPALPENRTVAVLPFEVVGGTPEDRAWATGLSATLSAMLARPTGTDLQVTPLDQLQVPQLDAASARTELGATLVLTGSVEQAGTVVRVAYRLLDAATSEPLRTASFSVASADAGALQVRLLDAALDMLDVPAAMVDRSALASSDTSVASAERFYLQGRGYVQHYDRPENIDSAIAAFTDAVALDSRYARAHAGLGEALWRKYESTREPRFAETAVASCTHALVLDPHLATAHVCLGRVHAGRGGHDEAAVQFRRAIEIEPANDDAYAGLAQAEEGLGRMDAAEQTYRQAIALRPRHWDSYNRLGRFYYGQGRYADAAQMFAQVVALVPDSFRGYSNLGGTYIHLGRYDEAIAALERSVAIRPTAVNTSNLGTAYFNRGRFTDAARAFEQAVTLLDTNYELWGNLADAYYWAPGERGRASDAYRRAIALGVPQLQVNARSAALIVKLALYHAMLGERADALDFVARALEIAPQDPHAHFWAAVSLNQLGDADRAIDLLEKAAAAGYSLAVVRDTPNLSNLWRYPRFQNLLRGQ